MFQKRDLDEKSMEELVAIAKQLKVANMPDSKDKLVYEIIDRQAEVGVGFDSAPARDRKSVV